MKVGELIKKLNKRDKSQIVYYIDKYGKHEITDVQPMLTKNGSVTIIMNGDGGRYDRKTESQTCDTCRYSYITCRFMDKGEPCHYEPKTELQTEYNEYREKIRMHDPHRDW